MRVQAIKEVKQVWLVEFGTSINRHYTRYHADQFARALKLNGTPYTLTHEFVGADGHLKRNRLESYLEL
jgi:predicted GTPase